MSPDYLSFAYAAIVAAGGSMGYVKSGSIPSLAAGLLFGTVIGVGAYQTSRDPHNYYTVLGASTVLSGVMGYRFYNSGKFMPAGLITTLSLVMVCRFAARGLGLLPVKEASRTITVNEEQGNPTSNATEEPAAEILLQEVQDTSEKLNEQPEANKETANQSKEETTDKSKEDAV